MDLKNVDHVIFGIAETMTIDLLDKLSGKTKRIFNKYIDHDRDGLLTYAAMEQFRGKCLVKNRVTGKLYETPQVAMMLKVA